MKTFNIIYLKRKKKLFCSRIMSNQPKIIKTVAMTTQRAQSLVHFKAHTTAT